MTAMKRPKYKDYSYDYTRFITDVNKYIDQEIQSHEVEVKEKEDKIEELTNQLFHDGHHK